MASPRQTVGHCKMVEERQIWRNSLHRASATGMFGLMTTGATTQRSKKKDPDNPSNILIV